MHKSFTSLCARGFCSHSLPQLVRIKRNLLHKSFTSLCARVLYSPSISQLVSLLKGLFCISPLPVFAQEVSALICLACSVLSLVFDLKVNVVAPCPSCLFQKWGHVQQSFINRLARGLCCRECAIWSVTKPNRLCFLLQKLLQEDCQDYISIIQEAIESKEDGEMAKGTIDNFMLFCSISNSVADPGCLSQIPDPGS